MESQGRQFSPEIATVAVPPELAPVFAAAQERVAAYFGNRVDDPTRSTITISGERYILVRAASMSVEFFDLVTSLYQDKGEAVARSVAGNLLFDLAHAIGRADAREFHSRMLITDPIERLSVGPVHFAHAGWAFVKLLPECRPTQDENCYLLYDHPYSFESDAWIRQGRTSRSPVCVMNAGYSSGWTQESFGVPLVSVEVSCRARGDPHCRFIMAHPSKIEEHLARYAKMNTGRNAADEIFVGDAAFEVPEFFKRKRLEDDLQRSFAELELRVEERTSELEAANRLLQNEIVERRRSEQRRSLLMRELDHRVKNTLASVISIMDNTWATTEGPDAFRASFRGRILALARTHDALAKSRWNGADLHELVDRTLRAYRRDDGPAVAFGGEPILLRPSAASALGMTLNELATNAAKYGALSVPTGVVEVSWKRLNSPEDNGADANIRLTWREQGGPSVRAPTRLGFGSSLIQGMIAHELSGRVSHEFEPEGVCCTIEFSSHAGTADSGAFDEVTHD